MRYDTRLGKYDGKPRPGGPRSTLCISSQVLFLFYPSQCLHTKEMHLLMV